MWQDWQSQCLAVSTGVQQGLMLLLQQIFCLESHMLRFCVQSFAPARSCSLARSWKCFRGKKLQISLPMTGVKILLQRYPGDSTPVALSALFLQPADTLGSASSLLLPKKHF